MMILIMNNRGIFMRACFCPNCGASLNFDDNNRDFGFCQFCGAKIILDDYRSTHRVVDEARIHEDETNRMIRLRELEIQEREREQARIDEERSRQAEQEREKIEQRKYKKQIFILFMISLLSFVIFIILGLKEEYIGAMIFFPISLVTFLINSLMQKTHSEASFAKLGMIKLTFSPKGSGDDKYYQSLQAMYVGVGFKNVTAVNMHDLIFGLLEKPGEVDSVTINGEEPIQGKWYYPNATIIIKYHGFKY